MEKVVHIHTTVLKDGSITPKELPFQEGDQVTVTVRVQERTLAGDKRYPLCGTPVRYVDP